MNKEKFFSKKRLLNKKTVVIAILLLVLIFCLTYLCSIRFKVWYIFHFSIDTHDFVDFKEHQNDFETLIYQLDSAMEKDDQLFKTYEDYFTDYGNRVVLYEYYLKDLFNEGLFDVSSSEWDEICSCMYSFPDDGCDSIVFYPEYPEYVFFECSELSDRFYIYTGGGRPSNKFLNEYWDKYEPCCKLEATNCDEYEVKGSKIVWYERKKLK